MALVLCWNVQASDAKQWYPYQSIPLPEVTPERLQTKLKLLELVSLRQWRVGKQTFDSFEMSLETCNLKISLTNKEIVISHDKFKRKKKKTPECSKKWLAYVAKDINATLKIMSVQQEAINLEKARNHSSTK